MDLSIIIVNFNVRFFLEQCLHSVVIAVKPYRNEIFVVDNNSVDGSVFMVRDKFPSVKLIVNNENLGFSKACNQALKLSSGKYCLLLNPDTVVEEDTFIKCINFMESHPEAGATGVKMIDGKGKFLPESKRALPTPSVAFYKIFGLSALFPFSKTFSRYHLNYLSNEETHAVEILSGAFMLIRRMALNKTGLLDEDFFMYGEDIDLSYRLIRAGFVNYYFPGTTIIHFKGESTKKGSINYVLLFYRAMIIFARKHFSRNNAWLFTTSLKLAIYFRALLALIRRLGKKFLQPFLDIVLIYSSFYFLSPLWGKYRFGTEEYYPGEFFIFIVPAYIMVWILSIYYSGGYEKPFRTGKIIRGYLAGTFIILVIYALLPENLRFSRALILLGTLWGLLILLFQRLIFQTAGCKEYRPPNDRKNRHVIIGLKEEITRVLHLFQKSRPSDEIIGFISPGGIDDPYYLGDLTRLKDIIKIHQIDEIIFCAKDISSRDIINHMITISELPVLIKIAPPESICIIGSNFVSAGEGLYNLYFNSISKLRNRQLKRLFDIISSLVILIFSPLLFFLFKTFRKTYSDSLKVLIGCKTWVSYNPSSDISSLPRLKSGVYHPQVDHIGSDPELLGKLNFEYARDYKLTNDLVILSRNIFRYSR